MATIPMTTEEYKKIMELINGGFTYQDQNLKEHTFRPSKKLSMAFTLQANLGLRIGDVLSLTPSNFRNNKLITTEEKTGKIQNRDISPILYGKVLEYINDNGIKVNEPLIDLKVRGVQKQLKIVCEYLGLTNISTHSFRKMYATLQYEANGNNIELVKELLNHTSIATTQKYIKVNQRAIDEASRNFMIM